MKMIFIIYTNAVDEEMVEVVKKYAGGYTKFNGVQGEGNGEPHLGSHVWPGMNNCIMTVIDPKHEKTLVKEINALEEMFSGISIRMFVMPVQSIY